MSKIILGIDPGLVNTGWAVILKENNSYRFLDSGTIKTKATDETSFRLKQINEGLNKVFKAFKIDTAGIEDSFVNKNASTSLKLGQARGAIILTVSIAGISLSEYSPTNIKKSIVGTGRADKDQIAMMVKVLLPKAEFKNEHEADALAIALCHGNTSC